MLIYENLLNIYDIPQEEQIWCLHSVVLDLRTVQ